VRLQRVGAVSMLRCNNGKFLLLGILAVLWMDDSGGFVTLPASNPEFVIRSARGTSLWAAEIARKPAVEVTKAFAFPTNRQQTQHQYLAVSDFAPTAWVFQA
jgi:hypothetical protein